MEREVEPMATDTLLGAEREPKDRTSIPKVLSWSLWFFLTRQVLRRSESCLKGTAEPRGSWMSAEGLEGHGGGLDIEGYATRGVELD